MSLYIEDNYLKFKKKKFHYLHLWYLNTNNVESIATKVYRLPTDQISAGDISTSMIDY